jgi:hypothetical protein
VTLVSNSTGLNGWHEFLLSASSGPAAPPACRLNARRSERVSHSFRLMPGKLRRRGARAARRPPPEVPADATRRRRLARAARPRRRGSARRLPGGTDRGAGARPRRRRAQPGPPADPAGHAAVGGAGGLRAASGHQPARRLAAAERHRALGLPGRPRLRRRGLQAAGAGRGGGDGTALRRYLRGARAPPRRPRRPDAGPLRRGGLRPRRDRPRSGRPAVARPARGSHGPTTASCRAS